MTKIAAWTFAIATLLALTLARRSIADPTTKPDQAENIFNFKSSDRKGPTTDPATPDDAQTAATQPAATAPTTAPIVRLPVPDPSDVAASTKLIRDLYAKEIASAGKYPDRQADLAELLLQAGHDEPTDHNAQYVMLTMSRDLAVAGSDLRLACRAADETASRFEVEPVKLKVAAALAIARTPLPLIDRRSFVMQLLALSDRLVTAERFNLVTQLDEQAHRIAVSSSEPFLIQHVRLEIADHTAARSAFGDASTARETLKTDLTNPAANLTFGKYCCYIQDDWVHGLPWLAAGNDAAARAAAKAELAGATTGDAQFALGESWWNIAAGESSSVKRRIQQHAEKFYHAAAAGLAGVSKLKLEKRMGELTAAEELGTPQAVDLLSLVDTNRDQVNGAWTTSASGALISDEENRSRVAVPYHPPLDYDYQVVFTRETGNDGIECICVGGAGGRQFAYSIGNWANTVAGFSEVESRAANNNVTTSRGRWLDNGHRHTLLVQVRAESIAAFLDGKSVSPEFKTDFRDLGLYYRNNLRRWDTLGLGTSNSSFTIHSAFVIEIKGHGHVVHSDSPELPPVTAVVTYLARMNGRQPYTVSVYGNGTAHSTLDSDAIWFLHGNNLIFRWNDFLDTCRLSADRKSFIGKTQYGDAVKGEVTDGSF